MFSPLARQNVLPNLHSLRCQVQQSVHVIGFADRTQCLFLTLATLTLYKNSFRKDLQSLKGLW